MNERNCGRNDCINNKVEKGLIFGADGALTALKGHEGRHKVTTANSAAARLKEFTWQVHWCVRVCVCLP